MNTKTILYGLAVFLVCCVVSALYYGHKREMIGYDRGYQAGYDSGYVAPHPADTEFVIVPVPDPYPVPVEVTPAGYELAPIGTFAQLQDRIDSLSSAVHDTTEIYIPVQIEEKEYRKPEYYAVVRGWHPELKYIETYNKTEYINNYIDRPVPYGVPYKWTLSAFAEAEATPFMFDAKAGLMYDRQIAGPLRGHVSAGYEYSSIGKGPFVKVGTKLNILQK